MVSEPDQVRDLAAEIITNDPTIRQSAESVVNKVVETRRQGLNVTIDMSTLTPKMKALEDAIDVARDAWDDLMSSLDEIKYTYEEETN